MKYSILLFASLREKMNCSILDIELNKPSITPDGLKQHLIDKYPEVEEIIISSYLAKNKMYAQEETILLPTDEIALIPPVSGG